MLTVREVLAFPSMQVGVPEVLAGHPGLDEAVRWVHIGEFKHLLLKGGELILSSGQGFSRTASGQREFIRELHGRGAVGLVIELGSVFATVPTAIVDECSKLDFPLVALHREVLFVEITEAVHARLVDSRVELFERVETALQPVTGALLGGCPLEDAVAQVAATLGNSIVLERRDGSAQVVAENRASHDEVLRAWESIVRGFSNAPDYFASAMRTPDGRTLGRLVLIKTGSDLNEFDQAVIRRAASMFGLVLVRAEDAEEESYSEGQILTDLMRGNISDTYARSRAEASGFRGTWLLPVAVCRSSRTVMREFRQENERWDRASRFIRSEFAQIHLPAIISSRGSDWEALLLVGLRSEAAWNRAMDRIAGIIHRAVTEHVDPAGQAAVVAACPPTDSWAGVGRALEGVVARLAGVTMASPRPWHNTTTPDIDILLWSLRDHPDLRAFVDARLGPILQSRNTTPLQTLEAFFRYGGRKAEVARHLNIERPSLYHRIDRINQLIGEDIRDESVALSLHVALRARRFLEDSAESNTA